MLEVAIVSTKCALRDEVPEFMEYWNNREWEPKKVEPEAVTEETVADSTEESTVTAEATEENA